MERVAFLIERTGERISCLLNPEDLEVRRSAGLRMRDEGSGFLAGRARTDHPLLATGGGVTELDLRLLFDVGVASADRAELSTSLQSPNGASIGTQDVRTYTRPLWDLAENAFSDGFGAPPCVRFIWGKSWDIPGVVVNVAERLDQFDANGTPQRSWLSLRLRRVEEPEPRDIPAAPVSPQFEPTSPPGSGDGQALPTVVVPVDEDGGPVVRLDQIAQEYYGNPNLACALGAFNDLDDLLLLEEGTNLVLPPAAALWRQA